VPSDPLTGPTVSIPTAPTQGPALLAASLGAWATNCVVLGDRARAEAVIVDPGQGASEAIPGLLARLGVRPVAILLTHGHLDHLWAAPALARAHGIPVHLHPADTWLWTSPPAAFGPGGDGLAAGFGFAGWDTDGVEVAPLSDGQRLALAGIELTVHHTPGHTPGHVTFTTGDLAGRSIELDGAALEAPAQVLLAGDLIFAGSIGRTDLAGGDPQAMMRSLRRTMAEHDDPTLVIPGHGPATRVGDERVSNPFLEER
jgi:hydroxyacylglutathione hydrolase